MVPAESVDDGLCILFYYSVLPVWQSAAQRGVSAASTTCSRCSVGVAFRAGPPPPPIVESQLHTPPPISRADRACPTILSHGQM